MLSDQATTRDLSDLPLAAPKDEQLAALTRERAHWHLTWSSDEDDSLLLSGRGRK